MDYSLCICSSMSNLWNFSFLCQKIILFREGVTFCACLHHFVIGLTVGRLCRPQSIATAFFVFPPSCVGQSPKVSLATFSSHALRRPFCILCNVVFSPSFVKRKKKMLRNQLGVNAELPTCALCWQCFIQRILKPGDF